MDTIVSKLFRAYRLYNVAIDVRCEKANVFQSSFELTGYITRYEGKELPVDLFQSSFELTGYITRQKSKIYQIYFLVSKLFRAYRLYNYPMVYNEDGEMVFQSSFELTGYITEDKVMKEKEFESFKALSSLQVI